MPELGGLWPAASAIPVLSAEPASTLLLVLSRFGVAGSTDRRAGHRQPLTQERTQMRMLIRHEGPALASDPQLVSSGPSLQSGPPPQLPQILYWATVLFEKQMPATCPVLPKDTHSQMRKGYI